MNLWGIDLGGTKIECVVLDKSSLQVVQRQRVPTEASLGYQHILGQIKKLIDIVSERAGERPTAIGFATPGVSEPATGLMKNCNTTCMNGQPMLQDLEATLQIPVRLANDANCFALAETRMGVGRDYPDAAVVFGVIMGTGVGGGLVVNKQIIKGQHGIAGEWGHNVLEEGGVLCYCGRRGCVEAVISGPALEKYYENESGDAVKLNEIVEKHLAGQDECATRAVNRLLENYGKALSTLINIIDPDLIIIGGGVGNIDLIYSEGYERIKKYVFNSGIFTTPVCKPALGDSAGVFGAALLWE
ncbi:ROK family protein [Niabella insulamsoli]|uniref:ROK family protein n=1 Tax=Niabella insulamsoli TaxID=3144874 RepID=UPI0031FDC8BA